VPIIGTCKYLVEIDGIVAGPAGGAITEGTRSGTINGDETRLFPSRTFNCPEGAFVGRAPVTVLGTETPITVTLI
jgi:hypothetical protein